MAKKDGLSKIQRELKRKTKKPKVSAKQKELKRVRRLISRAEKRGYRWDSSFKAGLKDLSWQKLRSYTPEKLYKQAMAVSKESGKVISGSERRREERSEAAKRAAETRKKKSVSKDPFSEFMNPPEGFEEDPFSQLMNPPEIPDDEAANLGDLILEQLQSMIDSAPDKKGASYITYIINENISLYGLDTVINSLAIAPDELIEAARVAIYYEDFEDNYQSRRWVRDFAELLNGYIMTVQEMKEFDESVPGV